MDQEVHAGTEGMKARAELNAATAVTADMDVALQVEAPVPQIAAQVPPAALKVQPRCA